ncbi:MULTISPECIES: recombinase family protein [Rhizobium]|uniref:recombinase family protein n=1 Tax=Rhizobium TaxID=379 RepID=UPI0013E0183A|nr:MULTISPECIES: recombinase family protein [Rhizobium]NEJ96254.1 resolvase [Rhizobium ruizarguesonis]WSH72197.1 recombinase family protein [Rhizobium leguminosarum]
MTMIRTYLRASTKDQDASRARAELQAFADQRGLKIAAEYMENESGASLARPELFKLIDQAHVGDILLIEQVDRLSRLKADDWENLKAKLAAKRIKVVALDLPTSHMMIDTNEFTGRMFEALNSMMLDMLAAISRKDYDDRRKRQAQGIAKIMADPITKAVKFKGKAEDVRRNTHVAELLKSGKSWSDVQALTGVSRMTVAKVAKRVREGAQ